MRLVNLLSVVAVNAVPLYGVKYRGWSAATVLLLYWLENLLTAVFTSARIALHRAWTRKRGHWRQGILGGQVNGRPDRATLLYAYAGFAFGFTLVHGFFIGVFIFVIAADHSEWIYLQFSAEQFRTGAWQMLGVLAAEFAVDAVQIGSRSFAWIKAYAQQRMGRVVIMHLTIIVGIGIMAATDAQLAILYALIGVKTLWSLVPARVSVAGDAKPPARMSRAAVEDEQVEGA